MIKKDQVRDARATERFLGIGYQSSASGSIPIARSRSANWVTFRSACSALSRSC
ncbi:hypothetical protein QUA42_26310 [Microcoleus sp. Pol11C2]|uniref:hypothetical protein n=1 Tax=Microcoleus sp. Pol11C2 TaxID=3055389 RepID=UPI002FD6E1ED